VHAAYVSARQPTGASQPANHTRSQTPCPTCPSQSDAARDAWRRHGPPPLLIGVDPRFVTSAAEGDDKGSPAAQDQKRWAPPQSARLLGFWASAGHDDDDDGQSGTFAHVCKGRLDALGVAFDFESPPVFVTFGSMAALLPEEDLRLLLEAIRDAVQVCERLLCLCVSLSVHLCTHGCFYTHTHARTHTRTHTHARARTHTHIHTPPPPPPPLFSY
jgi:hypothetical protein